MILRPPIPEATRTPAHSRDGKGILVPVFRSCTIIPLATLPTLFFFSPPTVLGANLAAADSAPCPAIDATVEKAAIFKVIADMQAAWNRGDFRGYMQGFKNPDVIFVSGGRFQDGWQGTLDHYIRDYGASPETRGTLRFSDIHIEILGPDAAQLISRYQLVRQQHSQYGINTRLMRKVGGQWVIALNHVSSSETPPPETLKESH
jgi:ketosteroid isomerase-like protein